MNTRIALNLHKRHVKHKLQTLWDPLVGSVRTVASLSEDQCTTSNNTWAPNRASRTKYALFSKAQHSVYHSLSRYSTTFYNHVWCVVRHRPQSWSLSRRSLTGYFRNAISQRATLQTKIANTVLLTQLSSRVMTTIMIM